MSVESEGGVSYNRIAQEVDMMDRWERKKSDERNKYEEYRIEMKVPLGIRHGSMRYREENGNVTGIMNILGKTTEFSGLLRDKQMMISGELDIGIRKIVYTGYGMIEEGSLHMQIKDKERTYDLTGHKEGV